jgi:hypothetical protein
LGNAVGYSKPVHVFVSDDGNGGFEFSNRDIYGASQKSCYQQDNYNQRGEADARESYADDSDKNQAESRNEQKQQNGKNPGAMRKIDCFSAHQLSATVMKIVG